MSDAIGRGGAVLAASRPPFLVLAPATVLLGAAVAIHGGARPDAAPLIATVVGALAAHVAVNTLNEYQDFHSGLDALTERTPFSGGSGALPARPAAARAVGIAALAAIAVTILAGLYLVWLRGPALLAIGLAGVAIIVSYTRWLNRHPWLCLLAPGIAFGPLMVLGSDLALGGAPDGAALAAALIGLCLASNLLLLNQYPDMAADRQVGRRTFPIAYGMAGANLAYAVLLGTAFALLAGAVLLGLFPALALVAGLPLAAGLAALAIARRHGDDIPRLLPGLGLNVAAAVLTPLVLGVTLLVAAP